MRHREAIKYLPDLGSGELTPGTEAAVASHVESCAACRDWAATRDVLADAVSGGWGHDGDHPDSELLAQCVLRPEEIYEVDRSELRRHLQDCRTCRKEVELVRAAVREARPGESEVPRPVPSQTATGRRRRAWLVAALFVLALGGGVLLERLLSNGLFLERAPHASDLRRDLGAEPAFEEAEVLSGGDVDGTHVIGGSRKLVVSELTVSGGADVTFRAGDVVAFGDGFRVLSGARMAVGSGVSGADDSQHATETTGRKASKN